MAKLRSFPLLREDEFELACQVFCEMFWVRKGTVSGIEVVLERKHGRPCITITRPVPLQQTPYLKQTPEQNNPEDEIPADVSPEDDDLEALIRNPTPSSPHSQIVTYHIVFSRGYSLPVLYVSLPPPYTQSLESIYSLLVPRTSASALKEVGVMGGLSVGNHPLTDVPMAFVHPCLTAEGMREVCRDREGGEVSVEEYLVVWVGLVGAGVGLWVPGEVVARSAEQIANED